MKPAYSLSKEGNFSISQYNLASPFASFFPGIAGEWGVPMWVFYVNRGQGIASFGIQEKDHSIMEFFPANRAWRWSTLQGFRTFIKIHQGKRVHYYEPFQYLKTHSQHILQKMDIQPHSLILSEENGELGLRFQVRYFTIPYEPFAALARVLKIENVTRKKQWLSIVDGMPAIIPYGMNEWFLKHMSRTIEAWVEVDNMERGVPFYRLRVEPHDRPEVVPIHRGNFYFGLSEKEGNEEPIRPIIDPEVLFGHVCDFSFPAQFVCTPLKIPRIQYYGEKTPSAFGFKETEIKPSEQFHLYSLFGHIESQEELNESLSRIRRKGFFESKEKENQQMIHHLTDPIQTQSGNSRWDAYCRQNFLDNLLRGGKPIQLGNQKKKVFYVYSRKHGDLERDYNQFVVPATYFSQGDVNYRDVNQNRRSDVWFYPEIKDQNVLTFFNLIQADGFNPLIFKGTRYWLKSTHHLVRPLQDFCSKPFTPGEVLIFIKKEKIALKVPIEEFLGELMDQCEEIEEADHGEGFWTDHWTYNMDLLESYLAIYPEKLEEVLLKKNVFTFYDNPFVVAPRSMKYILVNGKVRQFHAVYKDLEKEARIQARKEEPNKVRVKKGEGSVYNTSLLVKMLGVVVNKLASLDPEGIGIEMEAEKPNWYDALNGLPGLMGSSVCETFELKRWILFLKEAIGKLKLAKEGVFSPPEEMAHFMEMLSLILSHNSLDYWQESSVIKEKFREDVRFGFSGVEKNISLGTLDDFLNRAQEKIEQGIQKAYDPQKKLYQSYFYYEVKEYRKDEEGIHPIHLEKKVMPLFLEGLVHALRTEKDPKRARRLYSAVRKSSLYDSKLRMYRVCDSLLAESEEIGRCRVFTPGWLEHQSIWLHMEYKYLLELLRSGLYEEFYQEIPNTFISFLSAERYGRSPLENSSFLVSTVYPDSNLHGHGYVARLSGATAEFLNMWLWMTVGKEPFFLNQKNELNLRLNPILSKDFFTQKGEFECRFLGKIRVQYYNPKRFNTYGKDGAKPSQIYLTPNDRQSGEKIEIHGAIIQAPYAEWIRDGRIDSIEIELSQ